MIPHSFRRRRRFFANDFSVLNPVIWANEAILRLQPAMIYANLVNRDFDNSVAKFGDIVNAFVPGLFDWFRKGSLCENVVVQDASGAAIQVAMNQWPQVAFLICDGEENRNQLDLVQMLLIPAVQALAVGIDRILSNQVYQFLTTDAGLPNIAGHLGNISGTNFQDYVLELREIMNRNNVPLQDRQLVLSPASETAALSVTNWQNAAFTGDQENTQLVQGFMGRRFGFNMYSAPAEPEVLPGQQVITTTLTAAEPATTTVLPVTAATGMLVGQWLTVAGDDTPQQITAIAGLNITIAPGLKRAVANAAAVTIVKGGTVNNVGGYVGTTTTPRVIGWAKEILVTAFPANSGPQIGQMVTFGADTNRYSIVKLRIINVTTGDYGITLDRPLVNAIANAAAVNVGPAGKYNFAFLRNALTLVNRPLPQPRAGTGAVSKVVSDPVNKISIRSTISYDPNKQGHLVVLDTLMGVGVLNHALGVVLAG